MKSEIFFVVVSAFADLSDSSFSYLKDMPKAQRPYNSAVESHLSLEEVKRYLVERDVIA